MGIQGVGRGPVGHSTLDFGCRVDGGNSNPAQTVGFSCKPLLRRHNHVFDVLVRAARLTTGPRTRVAGDGPSRQQEGVGFVVLAGAQSVTDSHPQSAPKHTYTTHPPQVHTHTHTPVTPSPSHTHMEEHQQPCSWAAHFWGRPFAPAQPIPPQEPLPDKSTTPSPPTAQQGTCICTCLGCAPQCGPQCRKSNTPPAISSCTELCQDFLSVDATC